VVCARDVGANGDRNAGSQRAERAASIHRNLLGLIIILNAD
jgi:hypothetical protein